MRQAHYTPWTWHSVRAEVDEAPMHIFVMGANRWRDEQEWPLARTRYTPFYLSSKGHANTGKATARWFGTWIRKPSRTSILTIRAIPVPTMGGAVCCDPKIFPWGPMDQRPVEKRKDVLVYTSDPLKQDLEVTGLVRVVLYASTSAPDTDFTAKLIDVLPTGEARNLTDGLLRVRYRNGLEKAELGKPGEIYPLTIDAGVTSNVFLAGTPHPGRDFQQQFPAVRSQSEYRPFSRGRNGVEEGAADYLSQPDLSVACVVTAGAGN